MYLAVQEKDALKSRQLRVAAKKTLRDEKQKNWLEFVDKCAQERNHFKLAQSIYSKDFIKVNSKK